MCPVQVADAISTSTSCRVGFGWGEIWCGFVFTREAGSRAVKRASVSGLLGYVLGLWRY
jgi:hypothetical protein